MTDLSSNERLDDLIAGLDNIGKERDYHEYGLPIYSDEWMARMREFVRGWLSKHSETSGNDVRDGKPVCPIHGPFVPQPGCLYCSPAETPAESITEQRTAAKLRAVVDELWVQMDDNMCEDAQTGEHTITLNKEQAEYMFRLFWRLGGKYREGLEECGWEPGSSEKSNCNSSASTDDGASPSRTSSSSVECPKCRTQLAFEGDECGLCAEENRP